MILFYIKELEHDVARKPLTLFGIML
jgi:hypothetical protein